MSQENVQLAQQGYEAFGRGDLEAVGQTFADDVEWWTSDELPAGGEVKGRAETPPVGSRAFPSPTPTLGTAPIGLLTTRIPPDRQLLRYSVADSIAAHKPFVVVFATPRFCTSRTCGPVVDVVDRARRSFARSGIRFIHVEIYKDNDPAKGDNKWVRQWRLPTEPWTFIVGRDGRIKAKFEGSLSVRELESAVRRFLA